MYCKCTTPWVCYFIESLLPLSIFMNVYLDESGDLGFNFTNPYRNGGSSRYLTLCFAIVPSNLGSKLKRCVVKTYKKFKFPANTEIKGSQLTEVQKLYFISSVGNLINNNPTIKLGHITVFKQRVISHIASDSNKLYNYMINLSVLPIVKDEPIINLIRDERSVKVKSGNSLAEYLQTQLYFHLRSSSRLVDVPTNSTKCKHMIFIDWISNCIFRHFEDNESTVYNALVPFLSIDKRLYF